MPKLTRLHAALRRYSSVWMRLSAVCGSLLLAELSLRLLFPHFQLPYAQARFSPRYHHTSPEFSALLQQIRANPAAFKGDITVAVLGDSFVAGDKVDVSQRFTSIMQAYCDFSPVQRIKILNLGFSSYSTLLYERVYRDVVLKLDPEIVIVCLDQTDVADDYLYGHELSSRFDGTDSVRANANFQDTVLKNYESYPCTFFLLRNSQLFLRADMIKQRLTGTGFIPPVPDRLQFSEQFTAIARERTKLRLYLETCKVPESHGDLFKNSEAYIQSISLMKPPHQQLYFVTYPRAENLAGQRKSTILHNALPDSFASTPYFEYWIEQATLAARIDDIVFIHTSGDFRAAVASRNRQFYFHVNDVHWNEDGHRLFAEILEQRIVSKVRVR